MSDVLLRWASEEVGLGTPITNVEQVRSPPVAVPKQEESQA
jgi:hypothetical protein